MPVAAASSTICGGAGAGGGRSEAALAPATGACASLAAGPGETGIGMTGGGDASASIGRISVGPGAAAGDVRAIGAWEFRLKSAPIRTATVAPAPSTKPSKVQTTALAAGAPRATASLRACPAPCLNGSDVS